MGMLDVSDPTITDIGGQSVEELRDMFPSDIEFAHNRTQLQSDLLSDRIFAHEESLEDLKVVDQKPKKITKPQYKPVFLPEEYSNKRNVLISKELM